MPYDPVNLFDGARITTTSPIIMSPNPETLPAKTRKELENSVTDIVLLLEDRGGICRRSYREKKINVLHFPIRDFTAPTLEQLNQWIPRIETLANQPGHRILIHCEGGLGRTGTIAACLAASILGLTSEEAKAFVKAKVPMAIETPDQKQIIDQFAAALLKQKNPQPAATSQQLDPQRIQAAPPVIPPAQAQNVQDAGQAALAQQNLTPPPHPPASPSSSTPSTQQPLQPEQEDEGQPGWRWCCLPWKRKL